MNLIRAIQPVREELTGFLFVQHEETACLRRAAQMNHCDS